VNPLVYPYEAERVRRALARSAPDRVRKPQHEQHLLQTADSYLGNAERPWQLSQVKHIARQDLATFRWQTSNSNDN
jgi:hypothetical protein